MINCVIVEDEAVAARRLKKMLAQEQLMVLATLGSVQEAIDWFKSNQEPDLIFLDIQLGDGISFEIFEHVQPKSAIIFTTAYDDYAIKAFKLNSIDYILKPIKTEDLQTAISQYKQQKQPTQWSLQGLQSIFGNHYKERFLVKVGLALKSIPIQEVQCIYSQDKASYLYTTQHRSYLIDYSLDDLETQLNPKYFFRISRKAYIQLQHIQEMLAYAGNRLKINANNSPIELVVSRERVSDFKNWLGK